MASTLLLFIVSVLVLGAHAQKAVIRDLNLGIAQAIVHQFTEVYDASDPWVDLLLLTDPYVPYVPHATLELVQSSVLIHFAIYLPIYPVAQQCVAYAESVMAVHSRMRARAETAHLLPDVWWTKQKAMELCKYNRPGAIVDGKRRATFTSLHKVAASMAADTNSPV